MRGAVLLAVWWACLGIAWADVFPITVETYPPGAALHDQFGGFLGRSGQLIRLDWDREKGPLQLKISLDGHETQTKTVTLRELQKDHYPEKGVIDLEPSSTGVAIGDLLSYRRGLVGGLLLALIGLAVLVRQLIRARAQSAAAADRIPTQVGNYRLLEPLGQGGMSEVFRAQSAGDPNTLGVAVKLMHLEIGQDPEARARFQREVKAYLALSHPNLPKVYDWGEHEDGRLYLVMELLEGETLRDKMKRGPCEDDDVVHVLRAVGGALDYIHSKKFVHRDVKPSNVFLGKRGIVKLMDMGIATSQELAPLTRTGMAVGTPHYMAPEQVSGKASAYSDQYAMGIMAYEMLTGRRPFSGSDPAELLRKHLNDAPPPLVELRPSAPFPLQEAIHRILSKNPASRFPDAGAAAEAICGALGSDMPDDTLTQTSTEPVDFGQG